MSPINKIKLKILRNKIDNVDNSLIKLIKQRTTLVKKVIKIKETKKHIVDKPRIKKIKFLLKDKGMTIKGVKKVLISDESKLDEINNTTINTKNILKSKLSKISKIVKELKN